MLTAVLWSTIIIQKTYGICNFAKRQIFTVLLFLFCVIYYLYFTCYMSCLSHYLVRYWQRDRRCLERRSWFAIKALFKSASFSVLYIGIELSKFRVIFMSSSVGNARGADRKLHTSRLFPCGAAAQHVPWPSHSWGFIDHTQRRITFGRTPLEEWSASRKGLYLTTHNTHNRQTSMPPVGFEPKISAGEGYWDRLHF